MTANRKFEITKKYVPTVLPDNLNPSNEVSTINTNKEYLEETLGGYLSESLYKEMRQID